MKVRKQKPVAVLSFLLGFAHICGATELKLPLIEKYNLDNGLTVIIVEKHQVPLVEGQLVIKTGALSDPAGKEGLANMTAKMLIRGTTGQAAEDIAEALDDAGAEMSLYADWETSRLAFRVLKEELPRLLKLYAEMILQPAFNFDSLETEKERARDGIQSLAADNWALADQWLYRTLYTGSRLAVRPEGTSGSISGITHADIMTFFETHYRPNNALLFLGGDIDRGSLNEVKDLFGCWQYREEPEQRAPLRVSHVSGKTLWVVDKADLTQSQIRIGNVGITWNNPDFYVAQVMNTYFGGGFSCVLMEELRRKRGLTYGVSSQFDFGVEAGPFFIWTFTANEKIGEVIGLTLEIMERVRDGGIPEAEVEAAKSYLQGSFAARVQSPENLFSELLRLELSGQELDQLHTYADEIRGVTVQQVRGAAKKYIDPDNGIVLVLGRRSDIEKQLKDMTAKIRFASFNEIIEDWPVPF